ILVHSNGLILIDFECGHAGDAAFDLGFFLSHLILKAIHMSRQFPAERDRYLELIKRFWKAYGRKIDERRWRPPGLELRALAHAAACLLARVDGKSPVEYLDQADQVRVRRLALGAIGRRPEEFDALLDLLDEDLLAPG